MRRLVFVAGVVAALAGCAKPGFVTVIRTTTSTPTLPSQVAPDPQWNANAAHPDVPQFGFVIGLGLVLAAPRLLVSLPHPLRSAPGRNRTVEECKRFIELGAARYGNARVEAASLGKERRTPEGLYEGLVETRVIYDFHLFYEARQATVKCYSRPDGSIIRVEEASVT
jgi:hypothetical protein